MRTLTLLGIFFVLLVTAFRQPEQSFPDAATATANRAMEMVSDFTPEPHSITRGLSKNPTPSPVVDTVAKLKTEVAKLKENFQPSEVGEADKINTDFSNVWVMPPSKLEPGPSPAPVPVQNVETSVLNEPSIKSPSGKTEISDAREGEQDSHEEVARLLEEAARNLEGIQ